jgi:CRP-like cAMP-binding protein
MFFRRHDPIVDRLAALGVSAAAAERLSLAGTLLDLADGTKLCTEGERGTQAFLLLDGEVDVVAADRQVRVGPGEVVGELATLDRTRNRNATVVAAGPVSVLVFDVGTFRSLAGDDDLHALLVPERVAA